VLSKDGLLVLTAKDKDQTWTIDFVDDAGRWKIDWIAGYTPRILLWQNWEQRLLPKMGKRSTEQFDIYYPKGSTAEEDIEKIAGDREAGYSAISEFLGTKPRPRIQLILFESPYHETTHVLMRPYGDPPALFNEGFAVYMSERLGAHALEDLSGGKATIYQRVKELKGKSELINLGELLTYTEIGSKESRPPVAYPEAASFVKFLIDRYGKDKFLNAYRTLQNSDSEAVQQENIRALEQIYGTPLAELEKQWQKAFSSAQKPNAAVELKKGWGQVVGGLQLGLILDRKDGGYRQGDLVTLSIYVRNAGDTGQARTYYVWADDAGKVQPGRHTLRDKPHLMDAEGEPVPLKARMRGAAVVMDQKLSLQEGESRMLGKVRVAIEPLSTYQPAEYYAGLEAGPYRIAQSVNLYPRQMLEFPTDVLQLHTGERELTVLSHDLYVKQNQPTETTPVEGELEKDEDAAGTKTKGKSKNAGDPYRVERTETNEQCKEIERTNRKITTLTGNKVKSTEDFLTALAPGSELVVQNINGSITVNGKETAECRIEADIEVKAKSNEEAKKLLDKVEIKVASLGKQLSVKVHQPKLQSKESVKVDFEITVPRQADLQLYTSNGSLDIADITGQIKGKTNNGSISTVETAGETRLHTNNGKIEVSKADLKPGAIGVNNGEITCKHITGDIDVEANNGKVAVSYAKTASKMCNVSITTDNGAIDFTGPVNFSAEVKAETQIGSITTDLPLSVNGWMGKSVSGKLGTGEGKLRLKTSIGSIRIR
jgi:hypothetical protein